LEEEANETQVPREELLLWCQP